VPSAPTTDPWAWIVWGRELTHLRLDTVAGPPSWKPLPVLFTAPLSLLGAAAPAAWLAAARAGGLLALAFAYRLGARLAGPAAGAVAALALALSSGWLRDLAHGYSEGLAVALALWAVESHLDGRRGRALVLGALVALSRPEAWPFAVAYGVAIAWTDRRRIPLALGAAVAPPLLWLVPDSWGSGDPFHASVVARVNLLHAGPEPGLGVLRGGASLLATPVWLCAVVAVGLALRRREWTIALLGAGAAAWIAALAVATERGYPGSGHFLVVPAAVACVLAGAGAVGLVGLAAPERRRAALGWRPPPAASRAVLATVLAVAALPSLVPRAEALPASLRQSIVRARFEQELRASVARAGGGAAVLPLGRPIVPARLWWTAGALAWELRVPLERVGTIPETSLATLHGVRAGSVVFAPLAGTPPDDPAWEPARHRIGGRVLARAGIWRVLAGGAPTLRACSRCPPSPVSATSTTSSRPACACTLPRPGSPALRRCSCCTAGRSTGTCGATSSPA
jgi:hypothetical protein